MWLAVTSSALPDDLPVTSPNISYPAAAAAAAGELPDPFPRPLRAGRFGGEARQALLDGDGDRRAQGKRGERGEAGGTSGYASEGREMEGTRTEGDAKKTGNPPRGETRLERNMSSVIASQGKICCSFCNVLFY